MGTPTTPNFLTRGMTEKVMGWGRETNRGVGWRSVQGGEAEKLANGGLRYTHTHTQNQGEKFM